MKGRDGISRALYVVEQPKRVVVVRVFVKNAKDPAQGDKAGASESRGNHMTNVNELFEDWKNDPEFIKEYDALEEEFSLASALISARSHAHMTQQDVAEKMETSQSYIAKLEGGGVSPTMKALKRYAAATGSRLKIVFEPSSPQ